MAPKFDSLCNELLSHVFSFLPLSDLLSVYNICERFRDIVARDRRFINFNNLDFKQTRTLVADFYGKDSIKISQDIENNSIVVKGFLTILRYIRFLNRRLEQIEVQCLGGSRRTCSRVFHYIRLYLSNLRELSYANLRHDVIRFSIKNRITLLNATSCHFSTRMCSLGKIFPHLRTIFIQGSCTFDDIGRFITVYPNLQVMGLPIAYLDHEMYSHLTHLNSTSLVVGLDDNNMIFYNN